MKRDKTKDPNARDVPFGCPGLALIVMMAASSVSAQVSDPRLQALEDALPGSLLNNPLALDWETFGNGAEFKRISAPDEQGGRALSVTVHHPGPQAYDAGLNIPLTQAVTAGHELVVAIWTRCVVPASGLDRCTANFRFQRNQPPYSGFGDTPHMIGTDWTLIEWPVRATADLPLGQGAVSIHVAAAAQTLAFGQAYIIDLAPCQSDQATNKSG